MPPPVETIEVSDHGDLVRLRTRVREVARRLGLGQVDQVRLVTAASELARNIELYGGGGIVEIEQLETDERRGVRMTFLDQGDGIRDLDLAMMDGYSTGRGLGKGLPGAGRLVDEFLIASRIGTGTSVVIIKWA